MLLDRLRTAKNAHASWTIAPNAPQSRRNQLIRNSYCGLPFHTVTPESTFHWFFCACGSTAIAPVTQNTSKNMMMLVGSMRPVSMVKKHLHIRQMERALCPSIRESRYLPGGTTCGDAPGGSDSDMYRNKENKVTQTDKELRFESVLLQRKN